jgi:hypothetical protein
MSHNLNLSITLLANHNSIAEVTSATINLDAVMQELLEGGDVEDLVVDGLRSVDDELLRNLCALLLASTGWGLLHV